MNIEFDGRVVLVTGSHHQQQYWFETGRGRTIARLPFFWRIPAARFHVQLILLYSAL